MEGCTGRQTDTREPYFGGHPFHFTKYSTLTWGEREGDTVRYTDAPRTTCRAEGPIPSADRSPPKHIHNIHIYIPIYIYIYIYTHTHTHMCIYIYIYTHIFPSTRDPQTLIAPCPSQTVLPAKAQECTGPTHLRGTCARSLEPTSRVRGTCDRSLEPMSRVGNVHGQRSSVQCASAKTIILFLFLN